MRTYSKPESTISSGAETITNHLEKTLEVLTLISSFQDLDSIPHDKSNTPAIYTTYFTNVGIYILYSPCGAFPLELPFLLQ